MCSILKHWTDVTNYKLTWKKQHYMKFNQILLDI